MGIGQFRDGFQEGLSSRAGAGRLAKALGFYAVRVPVSGGREFPCDVLAAKGDDGRAYEVKVTKERSLYLYEEDLKGAGGVLPELRLPSLHRHTMEIC